MKKFRFVLFFALLFCLLWGRAGLAAERILRMDVTARVGADASLVVTERIAFTAEHVEIRRGLIREIPVVVREGGRRITAGFEVLGVKQDGKPAHYELHRAGRNMEIHLGDDRFLSKGRHEYVVTYRMTDQLMLHEDADELYWNVTGDGWIFPIERAAYRVELPKGAAIVESDAATGPAGTKGTDWRRNADGSFETTRALARGEGFTVMVAWPKGFVTPPPKTGVAAFIDRFGFDNLFAASALFVFACYALLWRFIGRDPKRGLVYPTWNPPDDLEPAYVGYIKKLEFGTDLLLADVVELAVRGYLTLEPHDDRLTVRRADAAGGSGDDLSVPQRKLLEALFPGGVAVRQLSGDPSKVGRAEARLTVSLPKLLRSFYNEAHKEPLIKKNRLATFLAVFSFLPMLLLLGTTIDWGDPAQYMPIVPVFLVSAFFLKTVLNLLFKAVPSTFRSLRRKRRAGAAGAFLSYFMMILVLTLAFVVFAHMAVTLFLTFGDRIPAVWRREYFLLACFGFALASAVFFSWHMEVRTALGRTLLDKVEGFEMYLDTAERHRLEMLYPAEMRNAHNLDGMPERTPQLFERLLPYAFALGVAETWVSGFAPILEAADYNPRWQTGTRFNVRGFASSMLEAGGSMRSVSTGGSGGGSSGRGGGTSSGGGRGGGGGRGR